MNHHIVDLSIFEVDPVLWLLVVSGKEAVAEWRDLEELLDHRVHVAHLPDVFDAAELVSHLTQRLVLGLLRFRNAVDLRLLVAFKNHHWELRPLMVVTQQQ